MVRKPADGTRATPLSLLAIAAVLLLIRIAALTMPPTIQPDLVAWRRLDELEAAMAGAGAKPVLYYYSADWCQPCRRLDSDVFHDPEAADDINARYIPVRVLDGETLSPRATALASRLAARHRVRAYPTLVIERPPTDSVVLEGYPSRAGVEQFLRSAIPPDP